MSLRPKRFRWPHKVVGNEVYVYVASGYPTKLGAAKLAEQVYPNCKVSFVKNEEDLKDL